MVNRYINQMENSFKIQTSPCMVSLLGEVQTFKIGDKVEVFNTITKKMSFVATIVGACTLMNDKGQKWGNSLRSARVKS